MSHFIDRVYWVGGAHNQISTGCKVCRSLAGIRLKLEDWLGKRRNSVWIEEESVGRKTETRKLPPFRCRAGER